MFNRNDINTEISKYYAREENILLYSSSSLKVHDEEI